MQESHPANAVTALLDEAIQAGAGARAALVGPSGSSTFADLADTVDRAAHGLRLRGVGRGDRVALLLVDGLPFAAVFLGAIRIGAVAVPLNTRLRPAEVAPILRDACPRLLVAEAERLEELATVDGTAGAATADEVLAQAPAGRIAPEPVGPDAIALWLYTSGTTGAPKAVMHRHRSLLAGRHYAAGVLGLTAADRIFATSRLFFAYALGNALLIPLQARASAYLHPGWPDPVSVAAVLAGYRPTLFFSVPTMYNRLLHADLPREAFASVRLAVSAGERLPAEIHRAWRARFGGEILDGIGATETIFMVLSNRPGASRPGTSGVPVPGTEARILDADGRVVADGAPGVLWVRTPSVAAGYRGRPEHWRAAFLDGWLRTGDLYYKDGDGFHVHSGREDDRFKVAGQWVVPSEVEALALAHPGVLDAGLAGVEVASGLVKPELFVVVGAESAATVESALRERLERALLPHQRPHRIRVVAELPRTATGKLQRFRLRELGREDRADAERMRE
ncbi:MAG: benzoate-CoA ligase family protein [Candidatus Rokubacteria bacterium]|nr:benzoate-CoA ligase family protein [Candidatus Rokubacteria bacterium]